MRKILYFILIAHTLLYTACAVHEWPETPREVMKLHIKLNYETEMTEWIHLYDGTEVIEKGYGNTYNNHQESGKIRYIVRAYPAGDKKNNKQDFTKEVIITKDVSEGYSHEMTLELSEGDYDIMVWSDLIQDTEENHFYDANNFTDIRLNENNIGGNNYNDAFRGVDAVSLDAITKSTKIDTLNITMQRPIAKFELIAEDMLEFIKGKGIFNIEDYKVVFHYMGFMPNAYSIFSDKPVDALTGVTFESRPTVICDNEVSLGFDYMFTRDVLSNTSVQFVIYGKGEEPVVKSDQIEIPISRSFHTKIYGNFFSDHNENSTIINPSYNGDHNLIM